MRTGSFGISYMTLRPRPPRAVSMILSGLQVLTRLFSVRLTLSLPISFTLTEWYSVPEPRQAAERAQRQESTLIEQ